MCGRTCCRKEAWIKCGVHGVGRPAEKFGLERYKRNSKKVIHFMIPIEFAGDSPLGWKIIIVNILNFVIPCTMVHFFYQICQFPVDCRYLPQR